MYLSHRKSYFSLSDILSKLIYRFHLYSLEVFFIPSLDETSEKEWKHRNFVVLRVIFFL